MNSTSGVDVVKYPSATPMNIIDKDVVGTKNASKTLYILLLFLEKQYGAQYDDIATIIKKIGKAIRGLQQKW